MAVIRSKKGVLVSVGTKDDGSVCLVLDDIVQMDTAKEWRKDCLITTKDISIEDIEEMNITEKEYMAIGQYIIARINAYQSMEEL